MSPINTFGVLAFAGAVLAVPHAHHHQHRHLHARGAPAYGEDPSSVAAPASSAPAYPVGSSSYSYYPGSSSYWGSASYSNSYSYSGSYSYRPTGGYPSYSASSAPPYPTSSEPAYPDLPKCWADCFGKYQVDSQGCLCTDTLGSVVSKCIAKGCDESDNETYEAWVKDYCEPVPPASNTYTYTTTPVAPVETEPATYSAGGYGGEPADPTEGQCVPDTTITEKVTEYVTVTAGPTETSPAAPTYGENYGAPGGGWGQYGEPSSSEAAPVSSSSAAWSYDPAAPSYAEPSSAAAAPSYAPASPSAPVDPTSAAPGAYETAKRAPSSVPSTGGASGFSGKRGLAYNDVGLTDAFMGSSSIGWGYNWAASSGGLSSQISYIPECHTQGDVGAWASAAQAAIDAGSQYLFFINEPDIASQGNMQPGDVASLWREHMEPFAGKAKLVAPAVSNGNGPGLGQDWLKQFLAACSDCTIDAVNQHWYDSTNNDIDFFKSQIQGAADVSGKPVFVGEFGFIGSDSDISSALTEAMSWMDSNDSILGYAYFMVGDGKLNSGSSLSSYGQTYAA